MITYRLAGPADAGARLAPHRDHAAPRRRAPAESGWQGVVSAIFASPDHLPRGRGSRRASSGMCALVFSYSTWSASPVCELQDVVVQPRADGRHVGRDLVRSGREHRAATAAVAGSSCWPRLEPRRACLLPQPGPGREDLPLLRARPAGRLSVGTAGSPGRRPAGTLLPAAPSRGSLTGSPAGVRAGGSRALRDLAGGRAQPLARRSGRTGRLSRLARSAPLRWWRRSRWPPPSPKGSRPETSSTTAPKMMLASGSAAALMISATSLTSWSERSVPPLMFSRMPRAPSMEVSSREELMAISAAFWARCSPVRSSDAHVSRARAGHDGADVGQVEVDETGNGDQVADALHALAQHVVGQAQGRDHRGAPVGHLEELVVGDHDDRVGPLRARLRTPSSACSPAACPRTRRGATPPRW